MNARDVLASLRIEDERPWTDAATDWQLEDALAVLEGEQPYNFLTRARGASKTSDLAAVALSLLLAADDAARLYWLGADTDQGRLAIDAIAGYVARTPSLGDHVEVQTRRVLALNSGAALDVLAADSAGAWGLRPFAVFCDELANWQDTTHPRRVWEAVSSAVAKLPTARLVVLTTAGDPAHFSAKILEHAIDSPMWRVHEVPGPAPWMDEDRLAEQRARLTESAYARLFMNEWTEAEDRLTTVDAVRECVTHDGPLDYESKRTYVVGLDLGLKRDRTVGTVCHREGSRVVLDRIATWQGSRLRPVRLSDVEEWVEQASRAFGRAHVILDPWQTVGLAQRLRARGLRVEEYAFTAQSVGRIAGTLYGLLRDRNLALPNDEELIDELAHVRLKETAPGVFRLDHDTGRHDDRAISLALAATHLLREPERGPWQLGPNVWREPGGLRAPWRPEHDGTQEHEAWAREYYDRTGERCEQCLIDWEAEDAQEHPEPEPEQVGKFLIHKGGTNGGTR